MYLNTFGKSIRCTGDFSFFFSSLRCTVALKRGAISIDCIDWVYLIELNSEHSSSKNARDVTCKAATVCSFLSCLARLGLSRIWLYNLALKRTHHFRFVLIPIEHSFFSPPPKEWGKKKLMDNPSWFTLSCCGRVLFMIIVTHFVDSKLCDKLCSCT